jgi:hypothetical protein
MLAVMASGCRGPGPEVEALETALPGVSNLADLESGSRFRYTRQDSSDGFFGNERAGIHTQAYRPRQGHTLEDVHHELIQRLQDDSWEQHELSVNSPLLNRWCGTKVGADDGIYYASTAIIENVGEGDQAYVSLGLKAANLC